jgi:hypothetical protein
MVRFHHPLPSPRPRPIQSPGFVADRKLGLRCSLDRLSVLGARRQLLILVRDGRVDAISEPHARPDATANPWGDPASFRLACVSTPMIVRAQGKQAGIFAQTRSASLKSRSLNLSSSMPDLLVKTIAPTPSDGRNDMFVRIPGSLPL